MRKRILKHRDNSRRTLRRLRSIAAKRRKSQNETPMDSESEYSEEDSPDISSATSDEDEIDPSGVSCDPQKHDESPRQSFSLPNSSAETTDSSSSSDEDDGCNVGRQRPYLDDSPNDSGSDDDFNTQNADSDYSRPLYPGCPISIAESVIMILHFFLRHCLSDSALCDLLILIAAHCPLFNECIKAQYFSRQFLAHSDIPIVKHYYCAGCSRKLEKSTDVCQQCERGTACDYFIEIPIQSQLQEFLERPGFYNNLNYRNERTKEAEENLEDIYDGAVYKKYTSATSDFDLTKQSNISFMWNSDGVPLFKSSKISIWPLFLKINELPPSERNKPSNMVMAGLWSGSAKPNANLFLKAFVPVTEALHRGISFHVHDLNKEILIRGIIICGTCDLPAKALFLNMKQYNGTCGCHKCLIKTDKFEKRRIYPTTKKSSLRTLAETKRHAAKAAHEGKAEKGVKGPTTLVSLVEDYIRYTALDHMHLLSGTSKLLLDIWISPEHKEQDASLYIHRRAINDRFCSITPPSFVERTPRDMSERHFWKASEYILWLLIYSPVVLKNIMTDEYFFHHMKLVYGVYLLYQDSILPGDIDRASQLLNSYLSEFERLYDRRFLSCVIHSFGHLCALVRDYGPLRTFSCFPFENANGVLTSILHATKDAQLQICRGVKTYIQLDGFKKKYLKAENVVAFCERLENKGNHHSKIFATAGDAKIIERPKKLTPVPAFIRQSLQNARIDGNSVYEFRRLLKNGRMYSSQSYTRCQKTNSTCIQYSRDDETVVGLIKSFVRVSNCSCNDSLCDTCRDSTNTSVIVVKCESSPAIQIPEPHTRVHYIHEFQDDHDGSFHAIDVSQIKGLNFLIKLPNNNSSYFVESIKL